TGTPGKPAGFGDVGQISLNDPFHPVAAIKHTESPAAPAPAPARPAAPAMAPAARRPAPMLPALEADAGTGDETVPGDPVPTPAAPSAASAGAGPAKGHPNELAEAPAVPATLTGTVGSGAGAVA